MGLRFSFSDVDLGGDRVFKYSTERRRLNLLNLASNASATPKFVKLSNLLTLLVSIIKFANLANFVLAGSEEGSSSSAGSAECPEFYSF